MDEGDTALIEEDVWGTWVTRLEREHVGLLVVDVQQKLTHAVERRCDMLHSLCKLIQGWRALQLPFVVTEQYPQGLGPTEPAVIEMLGSHYSPFSKTAFSASADDAVREHIEGLQKRQWVVVGIEAHVCVLQTVRDLVDEGHQVVVLNDCISSRSLYDYSSAIAEMRDLGARISTCETVLFELLGDAKAPEFKEISEIIKT